LKKDEIFLSDLESGIGQFLVFWSISVIFGPFLVFWSISVILVNFSFLVNLA